VKTYLTRWGLGFGLPLLAAGLLLAAGPHRPPPAPPPAKMVVPKMDDHLDYVFLASDRPVLLRIVPQVDGRPYHTAWVEYMKKWFGHFDRNGDGVLTKEEIEGRLPNTNALLSHLQGSIGNDLRRQTVAFAQVDTNKDGKVTFEEFANYHRNSGFGPLRFFTNSTEQNTDRINGLIYDYLDTNKDGKLSKEELARGPDLLRKLDVDEDEVWTEEELTPERPEGNSYARVAPPRVGRIRPVIQRSIALEVRPGMADNLAKQLIAHYDKNKDNKLSRDEVKFDRALFDELDTNKDGQLDAKELAKFFARPADLELIGRLGSMKGVGGLLSRVGITTSLQPRRVEVHNPKKRAMPAARAAKQLDDDSLQLTLGDARIDLQVNENRFRSRYLRTRQFYLEQFNALDIKKRGYVEKSQEKENQGNPFLFQIFPLADRDGDGKLTRKELEAYFELQGTGADCFVTIQLMNQGRSLFDLIDANGDRRLSVREFRTAWERAAPLARSAAGLAKEDIPRRIAVTMAQGNNAFFRRSPFGAPQGMVVRGKGQKPVPAWFTKMDRNFDGDISPKEFLGTEEEFRMLDLDGDGLISADEARAYEARRKKDGGKR
jgi:Ca2+-binding EF-hand superfamily protein